MRLRVVLVWLLMLLLPLQGVAAATMLFCAEGGEGHVHAAQAEAVVHDHALHMQGQHTATPAADDSSAPPASADTPHPCGLCASCCHAVAISAALAAVRAAPPPQAEPATSVAAVHSRPSPVPDKPPRA